MSSVGAAMDLNNRIYTLVLAVTLGGCSSSSGEQGFETGPCLANECFNGLVCLSDLCV